MTGHIEVIVFVVVVVVVGVVVFVRARCWNVVETSSSSSSLWRSTFVVVRCPGCLR